eukprot:CCRYP_000521-RA/>CCRYP_000521-RA protein AED:0.40 eAED:0.40 QI:206/1/1/1/0.87/0.77/9/1077/473
MTTYFIETAKSGRAKCKKCKETLPKDALRIGTKSIDTRFGPDNYSTTYNHPACFALPRKLGTITPEQFVQDHLEDTTPDLILSDETKRREIIDAIGSKKGVGRKSEGMEEGEENPVSKRVREIKALVAQQEEEGEAEPPTKKAKGGKWKKEVEAMKIYQKMTNERLKDVLRWNLGYGMTGTKDVLLLRCIDGHVNGRLARCPSCFKGHLQLCDNDAGETVKCGGYFDEDMSVRVPCSYQVKATAAKRLQPWYHEEPTEEETADMKAITEKHVANAGGGGGKAGDIPSGLLEAAKNLDWPDTSSIAGKKEAAKLMVEICRTAIDIPDDDKKATMGIGKIIVNNPDASANEILEQIVKEYGIKEVKKAASATQKDAMATSCVCAANAPIVQVFKELGELYFKEGNSNAGAAYTKAVNAIMSLNFEITEDNAKLLASKGKNGLKVDGIGKGSADKIFEFLTTGKIEKLEEKRQLAA